MILGIGKLPRNVLLKNPNGTWSFVGTVDGVLSYVTKDGGTPSDDDLRAARQCGPRIAGLRSRVWATADEARAEAERLGLPVTG